MFNPKWINKSYVLIRIDREKQEKKRGKVGSIIIPTQLVHMQYNQQIGEVVMAGTRIREAILPGIEAGDELFFHHSVEGTISLTDQEKKMSLKNNWCIYDNEYVDPKWKYYIVSENLIYGCRKAGTGEVIMAPEFALAIASDEESNNRDLRKVGNLFVFNNYLEERADIENRIKKMKAEAETHLDRAEKIMMEMETLTKSLNKKRAGSFVPIFISSKLRKDFGVDIDATWIFTYEFLGSSGTTPQVTTITIDDIIFYVLRDNYILEAKKSKKYVAAEVATLDETVKEYHKHQSKQLSHLSNEETRLAPGLLSVK